MNKIIEKVKTAFLQSRFFTSGFRRLLHRHTYYKELRHFLNELPLKDLVTLSVRGQLIQTMTNVRLYISRGADKVKRAVKKFRRAIKRAPAVYEVIIATYRARALLENAAFIAAGKALIGKALSRITARTRPAAVPAVQAKPARKRGGAWVNPLASFNLETPATMIALNAYLDAPGKDSPAKSAAQLKSRAKQLRDRHGWPAEAIAVFENYIANLTKAEAERARKFNEDNRNEAEINAYCAKTTRRYNRLLKVRVKKLLDAARFKFMRLKYKLFDVRRAAMWKISRRADRAAARVAGAARFAAAKITAAVMRLRNFARDIFEAKECAEFLALAEADRIRLEELNEAEQNGAEIETELDKILAELAATRAKKAQPQAKTVNDKAKTADAPPKKAAKKGRKSRRDDNSAQLSLDFDAEPQAETPRIGAIEAEEHAKAA